VQAFQPSWETVFKKNMHYFTDALALYEWSLAKFSEKIWTYKNDVWYIDIAELLQSPAPATLLYEWLSDKGFSSDSIPQILQALKNKHIGSLFYSETHEIVVDRTQLVLRAVQECPQNTPYFIEKQIETHEIEGKLLRLKESSIENDPVFSSKANPFQVCLDADKLKFPLKWRTWQIGDYFCPLGMAGKRKKLSDLWNDLKFNAFEKQKVRVLETADGSICWIVGIRIDERFKITDSTKHILVIEYLMKD
jgi:tRNA(Ile)-lysidine synthase